MRNLKVLGLAFVAALAMSAMAASSASATTAVVTGGPNVTGEDIPEGVTELTGLAGIKCGVATYTGTAVESTITLNPSFESCKSSTGAPATVTVNGCAYKLTMNGLNGHSAPVKHVELECPTGKVIEVHLYGDALHTIPACTLNIKAQTPTPEGLTVHDKTDGTLRVHGTVTGITSTVSGHCVTTAPFNLTHHGPIPSPIASVLHVDIKLRAGLGLQTKEEE